MMLIYSVRKIISYIPLIIFIFSFFISANPNDAASITNAFKTSNNSVDRRELLTSLRNYAPEEGEKTPAWIIDLLGEALKDNNPVVVAEAVFQVGEFKVTEYNDELVQLYKDAESKYQHCGYAERVRFSIIPALGKIGNSETKAFVADLLRYDNGSYMGQFLLEAVKSFNDPSFINDLKIYKYKMQSFIQSSKDKGHNPIIYSRKLFYLEFASAIEKDLQLMGGK